MSLSTSLNVNYIQGVYAGRFSLTSAWFCSNVFQKAAKEFHITLMWSAMVDLESQSSVNMLQYGMSFRRAWPLTSGSRSRGLKRRSSVSRWTGLHVSSSCANSRSSAGRMKFELCERTHYDYCVNKHGRCMQQNQYLPKVQLCDFAGTASWE